MPKRMLLGFAGPSGAGKSSAAAILCQGYWRKVSFADPIKDSVCDGLQIARADLEIEKRGDKQVRRWLRVIGDHGRAIDRNAYLRHARMTWLRAMQSEDLSVCVDDVRLDVEADAIRVDGGIVIHVTRPGCSANSDHATEFGVLVRGKDRVIHNSGALSDLQNSLLSVIADLHRRGSASMATEHGRDLSKLIRVG